MNLIVVTVPPGLSEENVEDVRAALAPVAERLNAEALVVGEDFKVNLTHDPSALHARLDRLCDAIEGLVMAQAPDEPEDGFPQPLSRPR
jgi:hypothetical protein